MASPYDYLSLAIENFIWRAVGFAEAFVFARQWVTHPAGAVAVAATYVGSGTMSWASLSYSALIGQMFPPWVLAGGSLAIRASPIPQVCRAAGVSGLAYGLMVWCAYPDAWLTATILSGQVLIALALSHRCAVLRLMLAAVGAAVGAAVIATTIISGVLSQSTSVTLIEESVIYSRTSPAMREGLLRGIDLIGLALVNPSHIPGVASPLLHPLYSGILPSAVLTSLLGTLRRASFLPLALATACLALIVSSTQNWTLWDHPVFREITALKAVTTFLDCTALLIIVAIPVVLAGGVFMNVKVNKLLMESPSIDRLWVMPSAGDESSAIGAAYLASRDLGVRDFARITNVYWGPEYSSSEAEDALAETGAADRYVVSRHEDINAEVARLLSAGGIVARFRGRMEFGARALGNRSILAHPGNPDVIRIINEQVKNRDFWMPFAPSILTEWVDRYVAGSVKTPSPHMMVGFESTPLARTHLRAALHPYDLTMRPQMVTPQDAPDYHDLLTKFASMSGIGGVLNTSFNIHGKPIVMSPRDALTAFANSGLQALALEDFLVMQSTSGVAP